MVMYHTLHYKYRVLWLSWFAQEGGGTLVFFKKVLGMIERGQKSKLKKSLDQKLTPKTSDAQFPSHKNFRKGLNDITPA